MARWLVPLGVAGLVLYLARSVLTPLVVAGVLAYLFSPVVDELEQRTRLPRLAVLGLLYLAAVGLLGLSLWLLEARLLQEVRALGEAGPDLLDAAFVRLLGSQTFPFLGQQVDAHVLAVWANQQLAGMLGTPSDVLHVAERVLDTLLKTVLTLLALFYLLLDGRRLGPYLLRFIPASRRAHVQEVAERVHRLLGRYLRGQLFLVGLMSTATFAVLELVFHLPYALPISIASGILEVIPLLGPVAAGTIASLVALGHGGVPMMLGVILAYFVLRQAEDQLVMPIVVGRAVELHPLVTIFAVLVGATNFGVLGAIMAVPVAAALRVTLDDLFPDADSRRQLPTPPPAA